LKNGSSPNSGESLSDLEEEIGVVAEAVGHAFDDLDLVVDAFQDAGVHWVMAVAEDAAEEALEADGEAFERFDAAADGAVVPLPKEALCISDAAITPQFLQVVLEHVHGKQPPVSGQQLFELHAIGVILDVRLVAQQQPA